MKKVAAIIFALLLMVFALSSAMADGVSGTFEGTAKGFGGDITVQLTLTDGVITAMTAEGASETPGSESRKAERDAHHASSQPFSYSRDQNASPAFVRRPPFDGSTSITLLLSCETLAESARNVDFTASSAPE